LRRSGNPANASGWMCFIRFWTRSNSRSRGTVPNAGESKLCRKEECKEIEWIWWNQMAQNPVIVTVVDGILLNEVNLKSHAAEFDKMNLCDETQPSWMDYRSQQLFKEYQESPWKAMERGRMKSFSKWKNLERIPTKFKRETLRYFSKTGIGMGNGIENETSIKLPRRVRMVRFRRPLHVPLLTIEMFWLFRHRSVWFGWAWNLWTEAEAIEAIRNSARHAAAWLMDTVPYIFAMTCHSRCWILNGTELRTEAELR